MDEQSDRSVQKNSPDDSGIVRRSWKNVIILGVIFILIGSAENTLLFLQSSIHQSGGMGVISSSVINIVNVLSSLLLSKLSVDLLGMRGTLVTCIVGYILYVGSNAYAHWGTLIAGGTIMGLATGPIWTAQSCYVHAVGTQRARITGENPEVLISKFFGLFFVLYQLSNVPSALVSSLILTNNDNTNGTIRDTYDVICGADFCPWSDSLGNHTHSKIKPPSSITIYVLIGACCGMTTLGIPLVLLGLDPVSSDPESQEAPAEDEEAGERKSRCSEVTESLFAAAVLLKEVKMLLILPMGITNGILVTFMTAEWTEAFVGCTLGVGMIGWSTLPYAVACSIGSYLSDRLNEKTNHLTVFVLSSLILCGVTLYFIFWKPNPDQLWLFLLLSALWGFGEAPWYPLVTALYGEAFPDRSGEAYANYNVWFGVGSVAAYVYSGYLCTKIKLYIVIASIVLAIALYSTSLIIDRRSTKVKKEDKESFCRDDVTI